MSIIWELKHASELKPGSARQPWFGTECRRSLTQEDFRTLISGGILQLVAVEADGGQLPLRIELCLADIGFMLMSRIIREYAVSRPLAANPMVCHGGSRTNPGTEDSMTNVYTDHELTDWIFGILDQKSGAGGFLTSLAELATRADAANYLILRPALLAIRDKYPDYSYAKLNPAPPLAAEAGG